eukprot:1150974-Pelagomonas_calceolata.AAC.6
MQDRPQSSQHQLECDLFNPENSETASRPEVGQKRDTGRGLDEGLFENRFAAAAAKIQGGCFLAQPIWKLSQNAFQWFVTSEHSTA